MSFKIILRYLKYKLVAANRKGHGIHSPFVFHLITDVFRNKTIPSIVLEIEKYRKELLNTGNTIKVKDLGAGSSRMSGNMRKISDMAESSPVNRKYGLLLHSMAREFGGEAVLELGTSFGISTMYMATAVPEGVVYTIEGCPESLSVAKNGFSKTGIGNIISFSGSFDEMIPHFAEKNITPGLVFIDGDHRKEPLLRYFEKVRQLSGNDTVIIIDDINYSDEVHDAWEIIRKWEGVSLTIDLFRFGLVFFRGGMTRADYTINY